MADIIDATKADPFAGAPSFSLSNRLQRYLFQIVWALLASWTPPPFRSWRLWLLRCFGARIDRTANVYGSARIWLPRNLSMEAYATLGPGVHCYSMGPISLGRYAVVSQRAHLCAGTHDIHNSHFQIKTYPISIGASAWICAEAFVGPGVTVGQGAVLAARGAAFSNLDPWTVYRGNPALAINKRNHFERDA